MLRFVFVIMCIALVDFTSEVPLNVNELGNENESKLMVDKNEFIKTIQSIGQKRSDIDNAGIEDLSCGTGSVPLRPDRIVGGAEARPHSHPWIVSLQLNGNHVCGGSLIRTGPLGESDIIMTAAHCVYGRTSDLTAVAGAHDLNQPTSEQQTVSGSQIIYHPEYNPDTMENDIAIVVLEEPIQFTSVVQPICLPESDEDLSSDTEMVVAGWGLTTEGGYDTSRKLMQAWVPLIDTSECASMYEPEGISIQEQTMLCAGHPDGSKNSCHGDNGGPLAARRGGAFVLHGTVSSGVGCASPGKPGVYARVSNYLPWINSQINSISSTG